MDVLATSWIRTGFTASLRKPINSISLLWKKNGFRSTRQSMPTAKRARWGHLVEIKALCEKGALGLYSGERLVGAFEPGHAEDASLTADVLLENLAAKVTAAHSLGSLLNALKLSPEEIDFVISCSEEAVGDRYNRGGGNLAKAIAEEVGCENASGSERQSLLRRPAVRDGSRREPDPIGCLQ